VGRGEGCRARVAHASGEQLGASLATSRSPEVMLRGATHFGGKTQGSGKRILKSYTFQEV